MTYNVFGGTLNFAQHQFKVKGEGHSKMMNDEGIPIDSSVSTNILLYNIVDVN